MRVPTEDEYFSDWYRWETIYEDLCVEIEPEEVVSINEGFGTSRGLTSIAGEAKWDDTRQLFRLTDLKVRKSARVNFYKNGYGLYEITDLTTGSVQKVLMKERARLYMNSDIYKLVNSNKPIYELNEVAGLDLSSNQNVIDYILFFFYSVTGRHGRFYPVTHYSQVSMLINLHLRATEFVDYYQNNLIRIKELFGSETPAELSITDANINREHESEIKLNDVYIIFKDSLFKANITILVKNGMVALSDENQVIDFAEELVL